MDDDEYRERMRRKKEAMDRKVAAASADKGILLALTGPGLGKSSSAYGAGVRALGHGMTLAIARLAPGEPGELAFFAAYPGVEIRCLDRDDGGALDARIAAWLDDGGPDVVVLDEVDAGVAGGLVDAGRLAARFAARPPMQHAVVTGAELPQSLLDQADTVTEMRDAKAVLESLEADAG